MPQAGADEWSSLALGDEDDVNEGCLGSNVGNLIKKPWAFIRVPYMNPSILGLQAQGFLIGFLH